MYVHNIYASTVTAALSTHAVEGIALAIGKVGARAAS